MDLNELNEQQAPALDIGELVERSTVQVSQDEGATRDPRYFFYAGDEPGRSWPGGLLTQSKSIPGGVLPRYAVMPCVTTAKWSRFVEIPQGELVPGSQYARPGLAQEWVYAGAEAFSLLEQYGNVSDPLRSRGLVELTPLRGRDWREVAALGITEYFFPDWPQKAPKTNREAFQQVEGILKSIRGDDERSRILRACGTLMLRAIEAAQRFQENVVTQTNLAITLPATEPGYKRDFDDADRLYSERTGVPLAMNSLRQNTSDSVRELVEAIGKQQQGVNPELISAIVAATVAALKSQEPAAPPVAPPLPEKKQAA